MTEALSTPRFGDLNATRPSAIGAAMPEEHPPHPVGDLVLTNPRQHLGVGHLDDLADVAPRKPGGIQVESGPSQLSNPVLEL